MVVKLIYQFLVVAFLQRLLVFYSLFFTHEQQLEYLTDFLTILMSLLPNQFFLMFLFMAALVLQTIPQKICEFLHIQLFGKEPLSLQNMKN